MFLKLNFFLNFPLHTKIITTNQSKIKNDCRKWYVSIPQIKILCHMLYIGIKLTLLRLNYVKGRSIICIFHFNRSFPPVNSDLKTMCKSSVFTKLDSCLQTKLFNISRFVSSVLLNNLIRNVLFKAQIMSHIYLLMIQE